MSTRVLLGQRSWRRWYGFRNTSFVLPVHASP